MKKVYSQCISNKVGADNFYFEGMYEGRRIGNSIILHNIFNEEIIFSEDEFKENFKEITNIKDFYFKLAEREALIFEDDSGFLIPHGRFLLSIDGGRQEKFGYSSDLSIEMGSTIKRIYESDIFKLEDIKKDSQYLKLIWER